MKAEVDKAYVDKLINVSASLDNLKTKVGVKKWETISVNLKKIGDAVDKEVVKNTKFNTLKTKVNKIDKKL